MPSDGYMSKSYEIVKKRIALGGYRLAEIIKGIKSSHDTNVMNINSNQKFEQEAKFFSLAEK